jgi:NAD-dependent DNA ligase
MANEIDYSFIPTHCPECGVLLSQTGRDLTCENEVCNSKVFGYLDRIMTIQAVDGIGGTLLEQFYESFKIKNIADLTNVIRYTTLFQLNQFFGGSTAKKFMQTIENLRAFSPTVGQYAWMANIPRLGNTASEEFNKNVPASEFITVVTSGEIPAKWGEMVGNYLGTSGMETLKKHFFKFSELTAIFNSRVTQKEYTKTAQQIKFSLTGALSKSRNEIIAEFAKFGCEFVKPNKASVFICDKASSSAKYQEAVKLGLKIMTEAEFRAAYIKETL